MYLQVLHNDGIKIVMLVFELQIKRNVSLIDR